MRPTVLVVDDNRSSADALARILRKKGFDASTLYDGGSAIERIRVDPPQIVLTDLRMEPVDGMSVLRAARAAEPPIDTFVFTAYGAVEVAVEAMRLGAVDFLTKPVTADQLTRRLDELTGRVTTDEDLIDIPGFVANASSSRNMLSLMKQASQVPTPVWIDGELGTGRGYLARILIQMRAPDTPFVTPTDSSWPAQGTVLIESVDALPLDEQRKLLERLSQHPELSVVTTASQQADQLLANGKLAPELFYRLSVLPIHVPALRERQEDILPMFSQMLEKFAQQYERPMPELPQEDLNTLRSHRWPGNIRELRNLAERAVVLGRLDLPNEQMDTGGGKFPNLGPTFSLSKYMEMQEREILAEALRQADGDRGQAGRLLGVERNTLRYKLKKHGLLE